MEGNMDDEWFKAFTFVFLVFVFVGVIILLLDVRYGPEEKIVVVSTCAELDNAGYDGVISCINQDGEIVRPGEN